MIEFEDIKTIKNAILKAGKIILHYQNKKNYQVNYKNPGDPVTTADDEANEIIIEAIEKIFPNDVIVSEEAYNDKTKAVVDQKRKNSKRVWIIDPLDGTKDFIKGLPYFAVSVGFLLDDKPELGFIYNPSKKFFLHGGNNYGIFYNDLLHNQRDRKIEKLEDLKICISTSEVKQNLFTELMKSIPEDNIEFIGSVAYKMGLIAYGEFDLILSKREKSDWDIAGGIALLQNLNFEILDQHFNPVVLNKESVLTDGLIVGSKSAVDLYRNFIG
ncbi:MAG: inositol monophosphatase family protein [Spirochaetia bacterium]|nr:inositol monophosphatase family protein [Spirochaetia bacterium]